MSTASNYFFKLRTEFIALDNLLKAMNLAASGAEAKQHIQGGLVKVNSEVELRVRRKLHPGDSVDFAGHKIQVAK